MDRLDRHLALLVKWNRRINLVAESTIANAWDRHFADSAQLWALRPADARTWLDVGAGAGFPGLVIASLAAEAAPDLSVGLAEPDQRKAAFLATVSREAGLGCTLFPDRWQSLADQQADVVSARALAPLGDLLALVEKHRRPGGLGLFLKGETVHKEIGEASLLWRFEHQIIPSRTQPKAAVLAIGACERA